MDWPPSGGSQTCLPREQFAVAEQVRAEKASMQVMTSFEDHSKMAERNQAAGVLASARNGAKFAAGCGPGVDVCRVVVNWVWGRYPGG